jgi:hypothetical protein
VPSGAEALVNLGASRGAEAPLFHGTITVRVEGGIKIKIKNNINVKGNGQECPFHPFLLFRP